MEKEIRIYLTQFCAGANEARLSSIFKIGNRNGKKKKKENFSSVMYSHLIKLI